MKIENTKYGEIKHHICKVANNTGTIKLITSMLSLFELSSYSGTPSGM